MRRQRRVLIGRSLNKHGYCLFPTFSPPTGPPARPPGRPGRPSPPPPPSFLLSFCALFYFSVSVSLFLSFIHLSLSPPPLTMKEKTG